MTEQSASATSSPSALTPPGGVSPPRRGTLLVIATATLLVVLDSTIVNVALPTVRSRLGFSPTGLEWVAIAMGRAVTRTGTRRPLLAGLLLAAGGACWLATQATTATSHAGLVGPLALFGLGLGLAVVPLTLTALSGVQPADAGVASALVSADQQVGAAVGLATLGTIAVGVAGHRATAPATALTDGYRAVFYVTAAILATAFLITTATLRPRRQQP